MKHLIPCLLLLILPVATAAEERTWTSSDGKKLQGEIVGLEGEEITLKIARKDVTFPLSRLSEADQEFAKAWKEKTTNPPEPSDTPKPRPGKKDIIAPLDAVKKGEWPNSVAADFDLDEIQIVKEDKKAKDFIYRSPHFEFHSPLRLSKSVVREFSRLFEATYEFAKAIPIGLDPHPPEDGYYQTQLYATEEEYYADGGMQGSAGIYNSGKGTGTIMVPLENLGVEFTGTRVIVNRRKSSDTLIHEITHQMTGRQWLHLNRPWFVEGLAETVSNQRYDGGRFTLTSMDRSIRDAILKYSDSDRKYTMLNLERLMTISGREWAEELSSPGNKNYPSANLLFYYYLRLEGDGKATNLLNYMKALAEGQDESEARAEVLMGGKSFAEVQKDLAKRWRSEGLHVSFD